MPESQLGTFISDCELAWAKGGRGCYLFNHVWHGFDRESERGKTKHPTQKPVALFRRVFERMSLQPGDLVFDPFMGSGPIAKVSQEDGLRYVGCEIVREYFHRAIARFG
jgi:DNA modification methylase